MVKSANATQWSTLFSIAWHCPLVRTRPGLVIGAVATHPPLFLREGGYWKKRKRERGVRRNQRLW